VKSSRVILAEGVHLKQVTKVEATSWAADWTLANTRILTSCPNERLQEEFSEYMTSSIEYAEEGHGMAEIPGVRRRIQAAPSVA
jgi:hypothetical protein